MKRKTYTLYAESEKITQLLEGLQTGNNRTSDELEELKRRLAGFIKGKVYTHAVYN